MFACTGLNLSANCTGSGGSITVTIVGDNIGTNQKSAFQGFGLRNTYYPVGAATTALYFTVANSVSPGYYTYSTPITINSTVLIDGGQGTPYISTETRSQNTNRILIMKL
jgi:hypothetical protein